MKKLLALILALVMIPVVVYCCDGAATLPALDESTAMCGEVWLAVQYNTGFLYGMLSPSEKVAVAPMQSASTRVRGITAQGVNRAKAEARYMLSDDEVVLGMTKVKASVTISAEYMQTVTAVVQRRIGEGAEINASAIVACTLRRTSCTVSHMMVGRNASKVLVGTVLFCGAERAADLYVADWDGDGQLDLVFSVNPGPTTKTTPAPTATPKPGKPSKPTKPTATPKPSDPQCLKIMIQVNIERISIHDVNIDSIFKPCGKVEGC